MIIDGKGRLFGKVSIIDILIVLVILITLAGIAPKFIKSGTGLQVPGGGPQKTKMIITFYGDEVPKFTADKVDKGQIVKETVKNSEFGKVTDFKTGPADTYITDENRIDFVHKSRPDYSSIYVTVEADGIFAPSGGITIDNADYYIGQSLNLKIGNTAFYIKVYDIKKKE